MPGLLDAFERGTVDYTWSTVESGWGEHHAVFRVFTDAARVDGVRLSCSAYEAQQCADLLGAVLPTPRLLDLRHQQSRINLDPHPIAGCPTDRAAVAQHSRMIDQQADGRAGLMSPVGKCWVLHERATITKSVLYGWHCIADGETWRGIRTYPSETDPTLRVIQPVSTAHNYLHHDYSMTLLLVHPRCELGGFRALTATVLTDPDLCDLLVASGRPLSSARLPGVPQTQMGPSGAAQAALDGLSGAAGAVAGALEDA